MAHSEQMDFVSGVRARFPVFFSRSNVLEVGSRNVNGTVRMFFDACNYVGLDCTPGPDVDVVCLAHEYKPDTIPLFDVIVSCEAFEHDPYLRKTITNVMRYLRVGGLFIATMASPARGEHGTRRTENSDGLFGPDPEYYAGVPSANLRAMLTPFLEPLTVITARAGLDVYAWGFRGTPADLTARDARTARRTRAG